MTRTPFGALIALALASSFAATWHFRGDLAQSFAVSTMTRPLAHATTWRFLPQAFDNNELEFDRSDIVVIGDHGGGRHPLTQHDIASIKNPPGIRTRLALAYVDIASITPETSFWDQAWALARPTWFDGDACVARSEMRVKFWDAEWKALIYRRAGSVLDRVIALGFDGVYVGGIHDLSRYGEPAEVLVTQATSFISELSAVARKKKLGFAVMADSNAQLVAHAGFRAAIDGVGVNGLLYGRDGNARRQFAEIRRDYDSLRPLYADGKPMFAVEYVKRARDVDEISRTLRRRGIVPGFELANASVNGACS